MANNTSRTDPYEHSRTIESIRHEQADAFRANPELRNSMGYWFPPLRDIVAELPDVHVPETLFVSIDPLNVFKLAQERDDLTDAEVDAIAQCPAEWNVDEIKRAVEAIGMPAFIRTDTDSDKHNIEAAGRISTADSDDIDATVDSLIRGVAGNSGMMGAPRFNFLAVREWIDIDSAFTAFGGTPIGPEVRVFAENGTVHCHHFYWPFHEDRMQNAVDGDYDLDTQLAVEEMEIEIDLAVEDHLADVAAEISTADEFTEEWSIDFALTTSGDWYVIDMARAEDSWHPDTCSRVPTPEPTDGEELTLDEEVDELLDEIDE